MEKYNSLLTLAELKYSIKISHNTVVGQDEVNCVFLMQLPKETLKLLLRINNKIWSEGKFPDIWRQTTIVQIPKAVYDNSDLQNY